MNDILMQDKSSYYFSEQVIKQAVNDQELKLQIIQFEYKLLSIYAHKYSIILLPKLNHPTEWHGMITVQFGLYSKAKFKFILTFTKSFPATIPKIRLLNPLTHPLVDDIGQVDVDTLIPKWKYGQDCMLYTLITKFYEMFIDISLLECQSSFNPEASNIYRTNPNNYADIIQKELQIHNSLIFQNREDFELHVYYVIQLVIGAQ